MPSFSVPLSGRGGRKAKPGYKLYINLIVTDGKFTKRPKTAAHAGSQGCQVLVTKKCQTLFLERKNVDIASNF